MKKFHWVIFLILLFVSLILNFYKFPRLVAFDADQEYFAQKYGEIIHEHKLTLIGIESSVGGLFVGPLYTYLNALVYSLFSGNPLGMNIVTSIFVSFQASLTYYFFSKISPSTSLRIKNQQVGLVAAIFCLLSAPLWGKGFIPSPINFLYPMGLFIFYLLTTLKERPRNIIWVILCLAISLQLHVSLWIFFPIVLILFIKEKVWKILKLQDYSLCFFFLLISLLPLFVFDLRHDFLIIKNLLQFLFHPKVGEVTYLENILRVPQSLTTALWSSIFPSIPGWVYLLLSLPVGYILIMGKKYKTLLIIFSISLLGFFFYRGPLPDYYFYFLLPAFLFLFSDMLIDLSNKLHSSFIIYSIIFVSLILNFSLFTQNLNPYNLFLKQQAVNYIKNQVGYTPVVVHIDTDLGLQYGFDYLLKYYQVQRVENASTTYEIRLRQHDKVVGQDFRDPHAKVGIKVVRLQ